MNSVETSAPAGGSGLRDRQAGAEEQPGADRATQADHGELTSTKATVQAGFVFRFHSKPLGG
jgi:hypothetical protein